MRSNINIKYNDQVFPYIIDYGKNSRTICMWENKNETHEFHTIIEGNDVYWCDDNGIIRLFKNDIEYYRDTNDWYNTTNITNKVNVNTTYIPENVKTSNLKLYIPAHSISTYIKGIKYVISVNTWINGVKIDLGSFIFKPTDTYAIPTGSIKNGNNEYFEYVDVDIIDPFYIMYADEWIAFRNNVCNEPLNINNTGSSLYVSMYVVNEYDGRYMLNDNCIGGSTNFIISDYSDHLALHMSTSLEPLGFKFDILMNNEYNWLSNYLLETYNIDNVSQRNIVYDIAIKNKDSIIVGLNDDEVFSLNEIPGHPNGIITQYIKWINLQNNNGIKTFFSNWNNFEEGWNLVSSLTIYDNQQNELLSLVSNEIPITQEVFAMYTNGGAEQIIDISDMNIHTYNVVNKITNNVLQVERPNESKSNIMQPVFFRVKDTEVLTLHPNVTENISINLDNYKSKVDKFVLQIDGCNFNQIGVNSYGVIFKITANNIISTSGTYYILNENMELITTGKYNCIK
jgi:hypothetical protein